MQGGRTDLSSPSSSSSVVNSSLEQMLRTFTSISVTAGKEGWNSPSYQYWINNFHYSCGVGNSQAGSKCLLFTTAWTTVNVVRVCFDTDIQSHSFVFRLSSFIWITWVDLKSACWKLCSCSDSSTESVNIKFLIHFSFLIINLSHSVTQTKQTKAQKNKHLTTS